ncbi:MAG: prepilin-type N-terminal cleavage/methylation domain-containing protein [Armatimonadetes bacterium]|nr:prepilin-type N-terminal cleavage/methylation domain-containing protein [Armatimonadota bacterium]
MKRAFTLIELLVVIAIIAILASILFPVFARAKESSRKAVSLTRAKQMSVGGALYMTDSDDTYWPLMYVGEAGQTQPDNYGFFRWPWLLKPYAKSFEVFIDPIDAERPDFRDPNSDMFGYAFGLTPSFGYNARTFSPGEDLSMPDLEPYRPVSTSAVSEPAQTLLFASSVYNEPADKPKVGFYRVYPPSKWTRELPMRGRSFGHVWPRFFDTYASTVWADGHVRSMTVSQLDHESLWTASKP